MKRIEWRSKTKQERAISQEHSKVNADICTEIIIIFAAAVATISSLIFLEHTEALISIIQQIIIIS